MRQVHQVAYLTMHGWAVWEETWSKEGFERTVQKSRWCGCCTEDVTTSEFDLDSAYDAQQEKDHGGG